MHPSPISNGSNCSAAHNHGEHASMPSNRIGNPALICAGDVMTRDVVTLSQQSTILEIISLMANQGFRQYLVVEAPRRLVGIISAHDILRALARESNWRYCHAHDLMSRHIITATRNTELSVAAAMMLSNRANCLPVIDDYGNVSGILTFTDLLKGYPGIRRRLANQNELTNSRAKSLVGAGAELIANLK